MCGRFEIHSSLEIIAKIFDLDQDGLAADLRQNYNVAPTNDVPIVRGGEARRLSLCRWGFVPSWSKDLSTGYKMINARAESVAEKPSFRQAFARQRCLVIADGFFEWRKEGKLKRPVYVRMRSREPFGFAGLYNVWTSLEGEQVCTCTIITTSANDLLAAVHDRMPVIAARDRHTLWLDPAVSDPAELAMVLKPYPSGEMEYYDVAPKMNSPRHNSPENIAPLARQ